METEAEKLPQEKGELDEKFEVLAENEDGWGLVQFEAPTMGLSIYTGRKSRTGRFFKSVIPRDDFFELARDVLKKVDAGEIEVEVE